jgi:hypothetical protein
MTRDFTLMNEIAIDNFVEDRHHDYTLMSTNNFKSSLQSRRSQGHNADFLINATRVDTQPSEFHPKYGLIAEAPAGGSTAVVSDGGALVCPSALTPSASLWALVTL